MSPLKPFRAKDVLLARKFKALILLLFATLGAGLFFIFYSQATSATNVYFSVGQSTVTDLKTGPATLSITSGAGVFSEAQTGNIGVGDKITYNTNQTAYIAGKTDADMMHWSLLTASGTLPADISNSSVVSITRAFGSLSAALTGAKDSSHLNNSDLVSSNFLLHLPCYYDSGPDVSAASVANYTTGAANYIHIYTPISTSTEANYSQRHLGKWNSGKYRLEVNNTSGIAGNNDYVRIDGLQIQVTATSSYVNGIAVSGKTATSATEISISNNIIKARLTGSSTADRAIVAYWGTTSPAVYKIWNNLIYDWVNGSQDIMALRIDHGTSYIYNNTVYNAKIGFNLANVEGTEIAINNLIQKTVTGYTGSFGALSKNNISDHADAPGTASQNSVTAFFIDTAAEDFHLAPKSLGVDSGVDLSADSGLPFSEDIDGQIRPAGGAWDIGADEDFHVPTDLTTPSVISFTMATTSSSAFVPILSLSASDNIGVTGFLVTEASSTPSLYDVNWSSSTPLGFSFGGSGIRRAYAWARDYEGNISLAATADVAITIPFVQAYYSVGQLKYSDGGGNLMSGSPTLDIVGGVVTFSLPQTGNIGVGDRVTYNSTNIAYIAAKSSTSVWNLVTATGTVPADIAGATVNSIGHEFNSLASAVSGARDSSHINNGDLLAVNAVLNLACYFDNGPDTSPVTINNFVTSGTNFIRIYTPFNTSTETNQSQRHSGVWNNAKYRLETSNATGIYDLVNNIRIEGLQLEVTADNSSRGIQFDAVDSGSGGDLRVVGNIIKGVFTGTSSDSQAIRRYQALAQPEIRVYNNIIYDFVNGTTTTFGGIYTEGTSSSYVYNNTVYNAYKAFWAGNGSRHVYKNNIAQKTTAGFTGVFNASSSNNISDHGDAVGLNPKGSVTVSFIDASNADFHLAPKAQGVDMGANLSSDSSLSFADDTDNEPRPSGAAWDIGADEDAHVQADFDAPVISAFSIPVTSTTTSVNVNSYSATDNVGITGYLITESSAVPSLYAGWSTNTPTVFNFGGLGSRTAYAWARDFEGNISQGASRDINIIVNPTFYESFDSMASIDANGGLYSNISLEDGKIGKGVSVGAGGLLSFSAIDRLDLRKGTIDFWAKPSWSGADDSQLRYFFDAKSGNEGMTFFKYNSPSPFKNYLPFKVWGQGAWSEVSSSLEEPNVVMSWKPGEWHHVQVYWDFSLSNTAKRYMAMVIDGNFSRIKNFNPTITQTLSDFYVGSMASGTSEAGAVIDELKIYKESLVSTIYDPKDQSTEYYYKRQFLNDGICQEFETHTDTPSDCPALDPGFSPGQDVLFYKSPAYRPVFRSTLPAVGSDGSALSYQAAAGEYRDLFFNVYSRIDLADVRLDYDGFTDEKGNVIGKEQSDIKVVKNWFQSGTGPMPALNPAYTPELMLSDDTATPESTTWSATNLPSLPVTDYAKTALDRDTSKQFSLRVKVPKNAPAGHYVSHIVLRAPGISDQTMNLGLDVLPFELEETDKDNVIYYESRLSTGGVGFGIFQKEMEDIRNHGFNGIILYPESDKANYAVKVGMAKELGFKTVIMLTAPTAELKTLLESNGFTPYFYGIDEPNSISAMVNSHIPLSMSIHGVGGKVFTAIERGWADRLDNPGDSIYETFTPGTKESLDWENMSAYSPPSVSNYFDSLVNGSITKKADRKNTYYWQIMQENPKINRFFAGFYLWHNKEDGISPFVYQQQMGGDPYNDFTPSASGYRNHFVTYPSQEGPVPTIQWEALSEGVNDVRYLVTWKKYRDLVAVRNPVFAQESTDAVNAALGKYNSYAAMMVLDMGQYENDRKLIASEIVRLMDYLNSSSFAASRSYGSTPFWLLRLINEKLAGLFNPIKSLVSDFVSTKPDSKPEKTPSNKAPLPPQKSKVSTPIKPNYSAKAQSVKLRLVKDLKYGVRGAEVEKLQRWLQQQGYLGKNIKINGYFGVSTKAAVIKYQRSKKIKPIGTVGPQTRAALAK